MNDNAVTPDCSACGHRLDRVDHYGIEHLVLDGEVYRPVNVAEGVASEVDLRCGRCHTSIPREVRVFFYRRWYQVLQAGRTLGEGG